MKIGVLQMTSGIDPGANAVVLGDVPDDSIAMGVPAKVRSKAGQDQ